jgi:hypothetical protein
MGIQPTATFGRDRYRFTPTPDHPSDRGLTFPFTVYICGIDEVYALVDRVLD